MKSNETKRERFVRLAETRTNKIIDMLRLIGNCSNRNNYDYTEEDVKKIFNAIDREVRMAKSKFNGTNEQDNERFSL